MNLPDIKLLERESTLATKAYYTALEDLGRLLMVCADHITAAIPHLQEEARRVERLRERFFRLCDLEIDARNARASAHDAEKLEKYLASATRNVEWMKENYPWCLEDAYKDKQASEEQLEQSKEPY